MTDVAWNFEPSKLVEKGKFIKANAERGKKLWSWLGEQAFEEFTLSTLSWSLQQSFKNDPLVKHVRLLRHLQLYWQTQYYKSTMIETFAEMLGNHTIHTIRFATAQSIRGSVAGSKTGKYIFHPPDLKLGEIILIPELNDIIRKPDIPEVLMEWTSQGKIHISLVKASSAFSNSEVIDNALEYGVEVHDGRMSYETDALMISALHVQSIQNMRKLPDAFWNRTLNLFHEPTKFNADLNKHVFKNSEHFRDDTTELRKGWRFFHDMRIEGTLPKLPNEWHDKFFDKHPKIGPRLKNHFDKTIYAHAFAKQPKRYGKYKKIYPELKLEQEDFDFAFDRLERWKLGLDFIRKQLRGRAPRIGVKEKIFIMIKERKNFETQEVSKELGVTDERVRQVLHELQDEGVPIKKEGVTKGTKWKLDIP